ncbi:MAG TPA: transcriptional repressor [bacterium]|nr:transcriptional repressor [bacterium]
MTASRRAVIQVLSAVQCAYSAEEIHRRARRRHPRLGLVTVYRTLELLVQQGLARRLDLPGPTRYEPTEEGRHHHHLVCLSCGSIEPLQRCLIEPVEGATFGRRFRVTGHRLELFGYCHECIAPA